MIAKKANLFSWMPVLITWLCIYIELEGLRDFLSDIDACYPI